MVGLFGVLMSSIFVVGVIVLSSVCRFSCYVLVCGVSDICLICVFMIVVCVIRFGYSGIMVMILLFGDISVCIVIISVLMFDEVMVICLMLIGWCSVFV